MSERKIPSLITIDQMQKSDLPDILAIEQESFPTPWTLGMFKRELESAHARCLCARINLHDKNILAAYIVFWLIAGEAHLHNLAVDQAYKRQGLALMLMETMREIAAKNEVATQTLEVRKSNIAAINLYQIFSSRRRHTRF